MKIRIGTSGEYPTRPFNCVCLHCYHDTVFQSVGIVDLFIAPYYVLGHRRCSNPGCNCHVFFIIEEPKTDGERKILALYPSVKIRFDSTNIPSSIRKSFEEAIDCFSYKNFRAAAVMIRRTVDQICQDKKAEGRDLYDRIEQLKTRIILPPEFFSGMHNLRMLGNDAAHTEAKIFEEIGEDEINISISFTKQIIEAVYQYDELLKKLEELKVKKD